VDTTLCDLVADLRAATPSAAAEAAVPVLADERDRLVVLARNLRRGLTGRAVDMRARLELSHRDLRRCAEQLVESRRARLEAVAGRLHALSPLATLARGFAVARGADGEPLTSAHQFSPGLAFALVLRDGRVPSQATGAPELSAPDAATPETSE
ncbi:MAG: exodeoxyribonuclease VII large subunit, partial [Gemmatimonadaceae bacterium]